MEETNIIIVGASTRAAAMSARRAGWTPWCADLFADVDLQRIATVCKVAAETYPPGLLDALAKAPQAPVIYTGALENRPDLIARIDRPLWGNPPAVLRAVRSPKRWTQCLHSHRIPCPAISDVPAKGRWLLKPIRSAGGFGIRAYTGEPFNPRSHFLQEQIDGTPCSAIFLGDGQTAHLLGVTQQLIGEPWLNAIGLHYAGNIGPLPVDPATARRWQAVGSALASAFLLRGLFGIDAIMRDGIPWPIEINPRYTASVELLERAYRLPLLPMHRNVFSPLGPREGPDIFSPLPPGERSGVKEGRSYVWPSSRFPSLLEKGESGLGMGEGKLSRTLTPRLSPKGSEEPEVQGKAVLYARGNFKFPVDGPWHASLQNGADPDLVEYADIPQAGELIEQGRPVLTLFASAATTAGCYANLREKAEALDRRLWG